MKKIVGIVSPATLYTTASTNDDRYNFGNNYGKRIVEAGGIPAGVLPVDGNVSDEMLDAFDSFIICGGHQILPYHLQVVDYAVRNSKPLLGICMGLQTIHCWFRLKEEMERTDFQGSMYQLYEKMDPELLTRVEGHILSTSAFARNDADIVKQTVGVLPNTHLARLLNSDQVSAISYHSYQANQPSPHLIISARAEDGTVEGLEYSDHILGVQFHPEADDTLLPLFRFLV